MSKELSIPDFMGTPAGRFLREWESSQVAGVVGDVFGYSAVQIGLPELDLLRGNRIATHIQILPPESRNLKNYSSQDPLNRILADFTEIPLASESQDLVVLAHALDFWETDAPAQKVLREAARILVPEGRIVLTAFNRAGLWSLRQRLSRIGLGGAFLPDVARPIALKRLQDWLSLLGFEVDRGHFGAYQMPSRTAAGLHRFEWMNLAGDRWWPALGSLVMLSATKHIAGPRLIGSTAFAAARALRKPGTQLAAESASRDESRKL